MKTSDPAPARARRRALLLANGAVTGLMMSRWGHHTTAAHKVATISAWTLLRGALIAGTMLPNSGLLGPVIRDFPARGREVWLTLDDGPDPRSTPALLDLLDRFGVCATFFLIGRNVAAHPDLARAIAERGHQIGNHTQTHPSAILWAASPRVLEREVGQATEQIQRTTGQRARLFRAPAGLTNPLLHSILWRQGLERVGWTARGYDGVRSRRSTSVQTILRKLQPGGIILFHGEGRAAASGPARLEALLTSLARAGYTCVLPRPHPVRSIFPQIGK